MKEAIKAYETLKMVKATEAEKVGPNDMWMPAFSQRVSLRSDLTAVTIVRCHRRTRTPFVNGPLFKPSLHPLNVGGLVGGPRRTGPTHTGGAIWAGAPN